MTIAHSTAESQAFLEEGGRISYEFLAAGRMGQGGRMGDGVFMGPSSGHGDETSQLCQPHLT